MVKPLGPAGIRRRMEELQSKMDAAFGKPSFQQILNSSSSSSPLKGDITKSGTTGSSNSTDPGGFKPLALGGNIGVLPAIGTPAKLAPSAMRDMIDAAAARHNVDPALLDALVKTESDYDPTCRSNAGAMGLTQLMPDTAKSLGVNDPFDPTQSLNGGAAYLRQMLDKFGSVEKALAAYNAGPGAVIKAGGIPPYAETQNYVRKIMTLYAGGTR
jgi:transglycosylase-like protein with SLT domain